MGLGSPRLVCASCPMPRRCRRCDTRARSPLSKMPAMRRFSWPAVPVRLGISHAIRTRRLWPSASRFAMLLLPGSVTVFWPSLNSRGQTGSYSSRVAEPPASAPRGRSFRSHDGGTCSARGTIAKGRGALPAAPLEPNIVADGNLYTGQNPASARPLAEAVVRRITS